MEATIVEKRRFPRIEFKTPLQYRIRGRGEYRNTLCEDVSAGGLSFCDSQFLAPDSRVMLEFNALAKPLHPVGRIAWTNHIPHSDRYRYGVEFIEADRETKNFLGDYIDMRTGKF